MLVVELKPFSRAAHLKAFRRHEETNRLACINARPMRAPMVFTIRRVLHAPVLVTYDLTGELNEAFRFLQYRRRLDLLAVHIATTRQGYFQPFGASCALARPVSPRVPRRSSELNRRYERSETIR
ncbi:hypothetical protein MES5069_700017 [Mesorhizobium escarrei]|uniref:Uncharacterized protein n=1 Tax=Mesorhizobium escarrei TaxID=666018 RepID=A0ABM9EIS9_9HYPH|nr:hypothetical protein MES5069_700017 [Mesorhizobium escarrei]